MRAYAVPNGLPGQLSNPSDPFFAGIIVETTSLEIRKGETKSVYFRLTVPIICDVSPCQVFLDNFVPDYGTCGGMMLIQKISDS